MKGKFSNADSEYNADNKKIIEHMGLTDVALTGGTSSDKKDAIEYSDGGSKTANFFGVVAKSTKTLGSLFSKLTGGPQTGHKLEVPLYWHDKCGKPDGKGLKVGTGTGVPSNCVLKFGFVYDKTEGDVVFLVVIDASLTNVFQKRFHSSWLTETVQKIVTDSSAVGAGVALGFALSAAGPVGVVVGAVVGTAAGNLLAKSADVIIGQQLRFIAKGTAAVATPAMALEVLGNDDFQTSIEELNADLKELEME